VGRGDQIIRENMPDFSKSSQNSLQAKNIPSPTLNLKFQNFYIKLLLKPYNAYYKPYFETAYLGENVTNLLEQKEAQNDIRLLNNKKSY
jgi:hypothetical protein